MLAYVINENYHRKRFAMGDEKNRIQFQNNNPNADAKLIKWNVHGVDA